MAVSVPGTLQAGGAVRCRFAVVVCGVGARRGGGSGGGKCDGVQAPGGADAHPPG